MRCSSKLLQTFLTLEKSQSMRPVALSRCRAGLMTCVETTATSRRLSKTGLGLSGVRQGTCDVEADAQVMTMSKWKHREVAFSRERWHVTAGLLQVSGRFRALEERMIRSKQNVNTRAALL